MIPQLLHLPTLLVSIGETQPVVLAMHQHLLQHHLFIRAQYLCQATSLTPTKLHNILIIVEACFGNDQGIDLEKATTH